MPLNLQVVFDEFPVLQTERLLLRAFTLDDSPAVLSLFSDGTVTSQTDVDTFETLDDARELVDEFLTEFEQRRAIRWAIWHRGDSVFVGECGYNFFDTRNHRAEIGYHLMRYYWGQGLMSEAVTAIIDFGFNEVGLNRIEADTLLWNIGSMKLLHRLGFAEECIARQRGYWKEAYHDLRMFALVRSDFHNNTVR